MTTQQIPEYIQASIHQDAINRVSGFFNSSTKDILNELLQNSRRSGATRINITIDDDQIAVEDDGQGIKDPQTLLSFGKTDWEDATVLNEHPAGMGLYSLARRTKVNIRSQTPDGVTWSVSLTPENFVGKEPAPIQQMPDHHASPGTRVTFSRDDQTELHDDRPRSIQEAVKYYPLPVYINNERVEQQDFLKNAVYVHEWQGVTIGAYLDLNTVHWDQKGMNFHGIHVTNPQFPEVQAIDTKWTAQVDVRDCPHMELTLPARSRVVETPFMAELREECLRTIYTAISIHSPHVDVPRQLQQHAKTMGILIQDATPKLELWEAKTAWETETYYRRTRNSLPHDPILMDLKQDLEAPDQQVLAWAADINKVTDRLLKPNEELAGYQWYDQLTRATDIRISVDQNGETHDIGDLRDNHTRLSNQRPDRITININTRDPNNEPGLVSLPTNLAFQDQEEHYIEDVKPLITKDSDTRLEDLVDVMKESYFRPGDDYDDDSYDTQEENHRTASEKILMSLLLSKEDAIKKAIAIAVGRNLASELPWGTTATIKVTRGQPIEIFLEDTEKAD